MNEKPHDFKFDHWWWSAWYVFVGLVILWLTYCVWLARPAEPWTKGWVGWWTGDRMASRPLCNFQKFVGDGSTIAPVDGNRAFQVRGHGAVIMGHWGQEAAKWTWAGWIKISLPEGKWPEDFWVVRTAMAPGFDVRVGFEAGRPKLSVAVLDPLGRMTIQHLYGQAAAPLDRWFHLGLSMDLHSECLSINGVPVIQQRAVGYNDVGLAELRLTSDLLVSGTDENKSGPGLIEQDDLVMFDHVVPPDHLAAIAARGRGGWAQEVGRADRAVKAWAFGWPVALTALALLPLLKFVPGGRESLRQGIRLIFRPSLRPFRWTLASGGLISAILTGVIAWQAKQADEQRFTELLRRFQQDTVTEWDQTASLLSRAKDWLSVQTNLDQNAWEVWLMANRFPYNYAGAVGIGYAQQVLPDQVAAHEAEWSTRLGFAYRVSPPISTPRQPVRELEGNPLLPIVLYRAPRADRRVWFTNHTILGHDLLFQSPYDKRPWAEARRVEEVAARNEMQTSSMEQIAPAEWYGITLRGLRLYMPWTLRNKIDSPQAVLQSAEWRGVVFASIDVTRELRDRFASAISPIGFRLYTGAMFGERFDLVADSTKFLVDSMDRPNAYLRRTIEIPLYYRRLFLDAWTTPAFEAQSMRRWPWIVGTAGGFFTVLAAALVFVQIRARERQAEVLEALRVANAKLLQASREREDLSRNLHDGSIQNLYALGLHLQNVKKLLGAAPEKAPAELDDSVSLLDQSITELRRFILTAGVAELPPHSVKSAIAGIAERVRKTTPVHLNLDLDEETVLLNPSAGVHVLHIVREAVSNSLRHARATSIEVRLKRSVGKDALPARWHLGVSDTGCGFLQEEVNGQGSGLKNMASRAAELGGRSEIISTPGVGTQVRVEFPDSEQVRMRFLSSAPNE